MQKYSSGSQYHSSVWHCFKNGCFVSPPNMHVKMPPILVSVSTFKPTEFLIAKKPKSPLLVHLQNHWEKGETPLLAFNPDFPSCLTA